MKVALLSYSHHGRSMANVAWQLGHEIVGVMDADDAPRQTLEEQFGCPGFKDAHDCLISTKPDAVLVAGKHIEMPSHVQACVNLRIPFLLDKPFADCADRLRPAAEACVKHGIFSALTMPNRASKLISTMEQLVDDGTFGDLVLYSSRLNNGSPARYDPTPSAWHSEPAISGGGSWGVEAAHGIETFLQFAGNSPIHVVGATMSNATHGRVVEDIGIGMLRTQSGITGIIESGFCYPAGVRAGDHFFRFVGTKATVFERYDEKGDPIIEVHTSHGVTFQADISHGARFQGVIATALDAIAYGRAFAPNIADAMRILEVQDAVYAHARANPLANGPHPLGMPSLSG